MLLFQCPDADTSVPFAGLRLFPLTPNLKESNDVFRACVAYVQDEAFTLPLYFPSALQITKLASAN